MQMSDEIRIQAPREKVYAALNDPQILEKSIPGCEELKKVSATEFTATIVTKIGPIKAKFTGEVTLSDLNPPAGYTISGAGKGGPAGFARGGAKIQLEEDGGATIMKYQIDVNIGGKLAQLGGRLIESTTKKLAGQFFTSFEELITEGGVKAPATAAASKAGSLAANPLVWLAGALIAIGALTYLFAAN